MTEQTADSLLMGGGASFFTFAVKNQIGQFVSKPYGTKVAGTVAAIGEPMQQTDYTTNALQTWPDGKPKMQFAITLDVDWNNTVDWTNPESWQQTGPADASDTQRGVMIKQSSQLQAALRDAIKDAGGTGLQLGAYVSFELTGEQPSQKGNPLKVYAVQYRLPAQGMVMDGGQPQQPAQQQAPPTQQYSPQAQAAMQGVQQAQQGYAPGQQVPQQAAPQAAPAPQQAPVQPSGQDPFAIAKQLLHELKLPPEQVAAATGLTVEQINQIAPF